MNGANRRPIITKIPFSVLWFSGAIWLFAVLNITNWLIFGSSGIDWIYIVPVVFLSPGWLVSLANRESVVSILLWMIASVLISFIVNFMAHYGLGAGDLGPGPV